MTKFEIKLHPNQIQVYNSPERFKVLICVPPGTVIPGENYNVVERIEVGERLYGETTNNIVVNTMKNEYNGDLIDINARYILPFKVTEDHPILVSKVIRNENYYQMKMGRRDKKTITTIDETKWVSAKEVLDLYNPSDRKTKYCLHIPRFEGKYTEVIFDLENYKYITKSSRYKNIKTLKLTEETAWLMGWFVAEGFCCDSHICYSVGKHEEHVAKEIVKKFADLGFSSNYKEKETAIVIYVGGKKISSLFERLFSKGAENKTIPEEILLNTDINIIGSFLKGYFSGDGYFDNNRNKISAKTASVELALKIQLMCARFGWLVSIGKGLRNESTILGRTITKRPFYRIESTNHELIKIVTGIDKTQKRREYGFVYDKFILIPIEKCKSTPFSGHVYNLTTSDNTFLVSNVFTHNCGRRFGKTYLAAYSVILSALKKNNGVFFVVSPSYAQTKIIWRMIKRFLPREYIKKIMEGELYIELINGSLIFAKSGDNPECYDDKTEILTEDGWKLFKDLNKTEMVFTLNPNTYVGEWKLPKRYIDEQYSGDMFAFKNKKQDLLVTPNHRFFIESEDGVNKFKTLDKVTHHDRIPTHTEGFEIQDNENISEDDCAIMGFYLAEGSAYGNNGGDITKRRGNYSVMFCQTEGNKGGNKGDVRSKFKQILESKGYNVHENEIGLYILNKKLWEKLVVLGNAHTKYIPKEYKNLPRRKLKHLFHWMIMGDGVITKDNRMYYYTVSKQLADDFQEVAIKCGYFAKISLKKCTTTYIKGRKINSTGHIYEVSIYTSKYNYFGNTNGSYISKQQYSGRVYCVEVENNIILVRRNGRACFSGNSLRGEGLDGVVLDEAAFLRPEVWNEAIRPALADKMGWALIISTPKGKTWLYELFLRGLDDSQPDYKSFRFSSFDNPLVPPSEIEEMSRNLPELSYKEEILAEFIEGGGVVFRNVDKVMRGYPEEPIPGVFYIMGVDLGRHEDFSVISVARTDQNRQVYLERFNQTDWDYIKERIRAVHFKYNRAPIIIDSTGYGDPIYEDLGKEGLNITGININVASKPKMIENLQLMIENNMIILINDKDASLEFSAYSYTILPSGNVRYEAPKGFHDDIVISTALMAMGLQGSGSDLMGEVAEVEDSPDAEVYNEIEDVEDWDDFNYDD